MSATGLVLVLWSIAHVHVEQSKRQVEDAREFFAANFPEDAAALVIEAQCEAVEVTQ